MEIRRGKLALIGKRGQRLDGLWRERRVVRYGCSDRIYDAWLRAVDIEVIKAARNTLIQSCDQQIKQWLASVVLAHQNQGGTHNQVRYERKVF